MHLQAGLLAAKAALENAFQEMHEAANPQHLKDYTVSAANTWNKIRRKLDRNFNSTINQVRAEALTAELARLQQECQYLGLRQQQWIALQQAKTAVVQQLQSTIRSCKQGVQASASRLEG